MATELSQAGPSRHSISPSQEKSPALENRGHTDLDSGLDEDEELDQGFESEYEDVLETAPLRGEDLRNSKGKGVAVSPRQRGASGHSEAHPLERTKSSWADLDLSIIVAFVSPIGNWLTGGDHIKNLFLIILLIFYLHQLIEAIIPDPFLFPVSFFHMLFDFSTTHEPSHSSVSWNLYQSSLPRKPARARLSSPPSSPSQPTTDAAAARLAAASLRRQELALLALTILSPLLGVLFLKVVLSALGNTDTLSWFSTTLFVLATGVRPWSHLVGRLQGRTKALHDAVHYPPAEHQSLVERELVKVSSRLNAMEREMRELRARAAHAARLQGVCDDLSEALGELERGKRKTESAQKVLIARLGAVETGLAQQQQRRRDDARIIGTASPAAAPLYAVAYAHAWWYIGPLIAGITRIPKAIWALGAAQPDFDKLRDNGGGGGAHAQPNGILKNGSVPLTPPVRSPAAHSAKHTPRLAPIPEAAHSDADSDGTYVSDPDAPPSAAARAREKVQRSRSRSGDSPGARGPMAGRGYGEWAFECAQGVLLWPYRASARVLAAVVPPVHRIFPGA
ncbi:hypothetical protein AcW1_002104 [Taiwanofungus camphoratus]|nr:hypothetical protein AcW1_002104 [Antrodia cinnamomea]